MNRAVPLIVACVLAAVLPAKDAGAAGRDTSASRCDVCHGMQNLAVREAADGPVQVLSVPLEAYRHSVHAGVTCQQCHQDVGAYPHPTASPRQRVSCDQDCHATGASGQPYTHRGVMADFKASAHARDGAASGTGPSCLTCHGGGNPHAIMPVRGLAPKARMAPCLTCHDDARRMAAAGRDTEAVASYRRSFHSKAVTFGSTTAAVCQDCHTAHRILPASDPRSSVSPRALPTTCGQTCHPGAQANFAVSGANHLDLRIRKEPLLVAEEWMFRLLTSGTMAMLAVGIVLDLQKKFAWASRLRRGVSAAARGMLRREER